MRQSGLRPLALLCLAALIAGLGAAPRARAAGGGPGFDYYLLTLSWTPAWCATTGDARRAVECAVGQRRGFSLHGLWPQRERGYPENCRSAARDPTRRETATMRDIMGSAGLAWHEWQKHRGITLPPALSRLSHPVRIAPKVVEEAFLEANPQLTAAGITVTCPAGRIAEVRICLTKDLRPRACGADVARDCPLPTAELDAPR